MKSLCKTLHSAAFLACGTVPVWSVSFDVSSPDGKTVVTVSRTCGL